MFCVYIYKGIIISVIMYTLLLHHWPLLSYKEYFNNNSFTQSKGNYVQDVLGSVLLTFSTVSAVRAGSYGLGFRGLSGGFCRNINQT